MNGQENSESTWSRGTKTAATVALLAWLFVVIAGPATNPYATPELTEPVRDSLRPVHQALYLGHGYRFFAPNPGPSHVLRFHVTRPDGSQLDGQLPDRGEHWPRLLYHRWFMLCETLFNELNSTAEETSHMEGQAAFRRQIEELKRGGQHGLARKLDRIRERTEYTHRTAVKRIDLLADAIANRLLEKYGGQSIVLDVHEREIPAPGAIAIGKKLNDPQRFSPPLKTWTVEAEK